MRKIYLALIATAALSSQSVLADDSMGKKMGMHDDMTNKACATIAKACKHADFDGKQFWFKCMKPVVLGQAVEGVKVDAGVVKDCRTFKISEMKKELSEMESVK